MGCVVAEVHRSTCPIPGVVDLGELAKRQSVKLSYTATVSASHTLCPVPLKFRGISSSIHRQDKRIPPQFQLKVTLVLCWCGAVRMESVAKYKVNAKL